MSIESIKPIQFNIVESTGNHYECGFIHGKTLKNIIQKIIGVWAENIKTMTSLPLDAYAKKIKTETLLFKTIQEYAPELLEEVYGIADGAELPRDIIETWQYLDEHEWFIKNFILNKKDFAGNGCSTFGFKNKNQVILGQNLDIPSYKNGIQTILKTKDTSGKSSIIFTQAGALSSMGANNSPLAICVNSLTQIAYRTDGLPVTYMIRKVLQCNSLEEAEQVLKTLPHATGQNYLIGTKNKFLNFECSANQTAFVETKIPDRVFHTNHILSNNDLRSVPALETNILQEKLNKFSSLSRYQCLEINLNHQDQLSRSQAQQILATPPVSISQNNNLKQFTFISAVFELDDKTKVWATPGAPEEYSYIPISWL